jgi:hypothetical protein
MGDGVEQVINEFKSWGHRVVTLRSDYENIFRSLNQHSAPGAHEKRAEIQIRYLRNRFEVLKASLPYFANHTLLESVE